MPRRGPRAGAWHASKAGDHALGRPRRQLTQEGTLQQELAAAPRDAGKEVLEDALDEAAAVVAGAGAGAAGAAGRVALLAAAPQHRVRLAAPGLAVGDCRLRGGSKVQ